MSRNVLTLSHLFPNTAYPGLGPFVRDQVGELARSHRITVVSPVRWLPPLPLDQTRRERTIPAVEAEPCGRVLRPRVPALPFGWLAIESRLWASRLGPILRRLYREIDGDLVHAHFAVPDGFAAAEFAAREGAPLVLTIHGSDVLVFGQQRSLRLLLRRTFDEARAIVAVSAELAARAVELGADGSRLHVIPSGVPYLPAVPRRAAREALGIAPESRCIVWVGGLVPVKQPLHAVEAFAHLYRRSDADLRLVVIGDGPLEREVRGAVRTLGIERVVHLAGRQSRESVWSWVCAADTLVNSSRSEGTPLAALEALGAGTPVGAYRVGGLGPAVDAVQGGTLTTERTPLGLADAVESELANPRDRDRLSRDARQLFDVGRSGAAIAEIYGAVS